MRRDIPDQRRTIQGLGPYTFTKVQGSSNLYTKIAKNRNYTITGRVAVLPVTGKYCMEKRGVTVPELSTVQKKPGYHADFVIWGFETLCFCKGAKVNLVTRNQNKWFGTLCFCKGAKDKERITDLSAWFGTLYFCKGAKDAFDK